MNRRHLFQLIGGAFAAAAMELGMTKPVVAGFDPSFSVIQDYMDPRMPRWNWVDGIGWVKHLGHSIAQEPNPSYVDSGE